MTFGKLPPGRYPPSSMALHWMVSPCVLLTIPIGICLPYTSAGELQDTLYNTHKSLGVLIFVLMVARTINRLVVGAPQADPSLKPWQRTVAGLVHSAIYVLLLLEPVLGYFANSTYGAATPFFGLFEIPPIVAADQDLAAKLFMVHRVIGVTLAILIAMHIGAVMHHTFVLKDGTLKRMLPWG